MVNKEAIIQEVARKHQVLLGPNDPILVTVTIQEEVFNAYLAEVEKSLERTAESMEDISMQYIEQSKRLAQSVVGAAVNDVSSQIRAEATKAAELFSAEVDKRLEQEQKQQKTFKTGIYTAAGISVLCLCGSIVFAALAVG